MENIYRFMLKYLDAMKLAERNGFGIDPHHRKALKFYDEIKRRITEPQPAREDGLYRSCLKVYTTFMTYDHDENLYRAFLQHWGITEKPYRVFYSDKQTIPPQKYVFVFFVDYNGEGEHARNCGNGERYYGNGTSTTRQQFWDEIRAQYKDCHWTDVCDVSDVYEEPESVLYEFDGFLYREFVMKKGE